MKKVFLTMVILNIILGCSKENNCIEHIRQNCVCTAQYDPVCGCNGKTYGNACEAACASVEVSYKGECPK